jgi:hypothetical protein
MQKCVAYLLDAFRRRRLGLCTMAPARLPISSAARSTLIVVVRSARGHRRLGASRRGWCSCCQSRWPRWDSTWSRRWLRSWAAPMRCTKGKAPTQVGFEGVVETVGGGLCDLECGTVRVAGPEARGRCDYGPERASREGNLDDGCRQPEDAG